MKRKCLKFLNKLLLILKRAVEDQILIQIHNNSKQEKKPNQKSFFKKTLFFCFLEIKNFETIEKKMEKKIR